MFKVKLEYGTDNGRLLVYNAAGRFDKWEKVCLKGWSTSHSKIACSQLGYIDYNGFEETTESFRQKSLVIFPSVDTDNHLIQSYLVKSNGTTCPNGKVIGLVCGNPVFGTRPAYYPSPLRVVNGDEVKPGTWPFVIELLGGRRRVHFCGAVIIGQRWVMTAAHCIGPKRKSDGIYLNIGGIRRFAYSKYRQTKRAKVFYVHPNYSSMTVENDIALIETSSPIQFNDYVRPVCLPGSDDEIPVGTRCYVTGWGKTGKNEADFSLTLMEVSLNIVEWRKCKKDIDNAPITTPFELKSNNICAGGGFSHDACSGDSGGPLLCPSSPSGDTWKATGIVSWGLGCAVPNVPGVYTQVSKYASWIRNVTRNGVMVP